MLIIFNSMLLFLIFGFIEFLMFDFFFQLFLRPLPLNPIAIIHIPHISINNYFKSHSAPQLSKLIFYSRL